MRQLLTESVLLALLGSVVGMLLASWLLRLFLALAPANFAGVQTIRIDTAGAADHAVDAFATGLLFGLAPARHGFTVDPNDSLRDTGARGATSGGNKGASRALVIAEVALAMVLVIGAGLMVKSLLRLQAQETGFRTDGLMTFQVNLPQAAYPKDETVVQTYQRILDEVALDPRRPGDRRRQHAAARQLRLQHQLRHRRPAAVHAAGSRAGPRAAVRLAGYFRAMGMTVSRGRNVTDADTATSTQVVVINQAMANRFWPDGNPIGERLSFGPGAQNENQIVGVVNDIRDFGLSTTPVVEGYFPLAQAPTRAMGIVVRSEIADPATTAARHPAADRRASIRTCRSSSRRRWTLSSAPRPAARACRRR